MDILKFFIFAKLAGVFVLQIMGQFKKIDNPIFSSIYRTYIDSLYRYGINLGYTHDTCLDAIQDVFYNLYISNAITKVENLKYYLFRCLKNRLFDIHKSQKKEILNIDINDQYFNIEVSLMDSIIEQEKQKMIIDKIESLLKQLTNRQREAIYLRYIQEMEYDDIGKLLNMSGHSVKQLVYRGISRLRQNPDIDLSLFLVVLAIKMMQES